MVCIVSWLPIVCLLYAYCILYLEKYQFYKKIHKETDICYYVDRET